MTDVRERQPIETLVIGGGQAGLSVGYHLSRLGLPFLIVDASERIGDAWRERWDSLRLFTPAAFNGLDGMPYPAPARDFPSKDEMAAYLEAYADRFELPVQSGTRVEHLGRGPDGRFLATAGDCVYEADQVVVAMSNYQKPRTPDFSGGLHEAIRQLHSADYRNPGQLRPGPVLLVGSGNSASEIARELAPRHQVWMSGRDVGQIPFRIDGAFGRLIGVRLVLRFLYHRVLTMRTPVGRKVRGKVLNQGVPLIRVKRKDLEGAGVEMVPRTTGLKDGLPVLEDGRVLEPANVVWCTGFHPGFDWIDLDGLDDVDQAHASGRVGRHPGLWFVGLHFLHALSSGMVHGVGRDAKRVAGEIAARTRRFGPQVVGPRPGAEVRVSIDAS